MTQTIQLAIPQFQTFLVVMMRVGAIVAAFPLIGSRTVPHLVKMGLVLALALTLTPLVPSTPSPMEIDALGIGLLAEFLIGLVIGLAVRGMFAGFELAGELMGNQMGFGVAQLFDPATSHQVPLMSQFQITLASLLFLAFNLHMSVVHAVGESFRLIPPYGAVLSSALLEDVLHLFGGIFVVAVKLSAPVVVVALTVNLIMALMGRAVSQLNIFILSFPLTIALGLLAMGLALPTMAGFYLAEFESLARALDGLMRDLQHE